LIRDAFPRFLHHCMDIKTFKFKEGTVIASVSEEQQFNLKTKTITDTGRFTACLIGGTAPGLKTTRVMDGKGKAERVFSSEEAAFEAAFEAAKKQGYTPTGGKNKRAALP